MRARAALPERGTVRRFDCRDCGVNTLRSGEYYMVSNSVWAATGIAPDEGMLCLDCVERRIGRLLEYRDFTAIVPPSWKSHLRRRRWRGTALPRAPLAEQLELFSHRVARQGIGVSRDGGRRLGRRPPG